MQSHRNSIWNVLSKILYLQSLSIMLIILPFFQVFRSDQKSRKGWVTKNNYKQLKMWGHLFKSSKKKQIENIYISKFFLNITYYAGTVSFFHYFLNKDKTTEIFLPYLIFIFEHFSNWSNDFNASASNLILLKVRRKNIVRFHTWFN